MHIGVFSYNTEYTMAADELAVACEERGYESLWLPEHTHIPVVERCPRNISICPTRLSGWLPRPQ